MARSASESPVREILENRISTLLPDLESELGKFVSEQCARARRDLADELNQAARRIEQAADAAAIAATLVEATAALSAGAALLAVGDSALRGQQIRGLAEPCAETFRNLAMPLEVAPALAEAVRSRDPVTAMATAGEISGELASLLGRAYQERIQVYPLAAAGRVCAVLCTWGNINGPAVELLAQIAAAAWQAIPAPSGIVQVTRLETSASTKAAMPPSGPGLSWDKLSAAEQQIHLRAQRRARVAVAEMRLHAAEAIESGRAQRDLYAALGPRIDAERESFHKQYFSATPTMVDYLHLELLRTLAHDDPHVLGKDYPGSLA
jgi:hypothetical protein